MATGKSRDGADRIDAKNPRDLLCGHAAFNAAVNLGELLFS
ncbi:UNVERIFIED_ORG: hypothetical protein J2W19_003181 [Shinella zoogloeoides]|nr:hypothetical protein [Shinella zoogloeoides]